MTDVRMALKKRGVVVLKQAQTSSVHTSLDKKIGLDFDIVK